jgi:hypothetical protein
LPEPIIEQPLPQPVIPPDIPQLADEVSTDDVIAQFAGTPLGEMATRMAQQESPGEDYATTDTAIPAATISQLKSEYGTTGDYTFQPPPSPKKPGAGKKISLIIVLAVLGVFSVASVGMLLISLVQKPKSGIENRTEPILQPDQNRQSPIDDEFPDEEFGEIRENALPGDAVKADTQTQPVAVPHDTVVKQPASETTHPISQIFFKSAYTFNKRAISKERGSFLNPLFAIC